MPARKPRSEQAKARRVEALRTMLENRRRELAGQLRDRMRDVQTGTARERIDPGDDAECEGQEDVDLALIQMASQLLRRVEAALVRLDLGTYGLCVECEEDIADRRLQALPFAARCTGCETALEAKQSFSGVRSRTPFSLDSVE